MFSLIISIISILLVAALALAAIYYGGEALNKSQAQADAARLVNEGQQLLGAAEIYRADKGAWPPTLQALRAGGYLQAKVRSVTPSWLATAQAESGLLWVMPAQGVPAFLTEVAVKEDVCREVNLKIRGDDGILSLPSTLYSVQCFGAADSYKVVTSRTADDLIAALGAANVTSTAAPASDSAPEWSQSPRVRPQGSAAAPDTGASQPSDADNTGSVITPVWTGRVSSQGRVSIDDPNWGNVSASLQVTLVPSQAISDVTVELLNNPIPIDPETASGASRPFALTDSFTFRGTRYSGSTLYIADYDTVSSTGCANVAADGSCEVNLNFNQGVSGGLCDPIDTTAPWQIRVSYTLQGQRRTEVFSQSGSYGGACW